MIKVKMFKIVLPEILQIVEKLEQSNRLTTVFTQCYCKQKQNQIKFKIVGVMRQFMMQGAKQVEGNGQIIINNGYNKIIYFGSWLDSDFTVYSIISDLVNVFNNILIFYGNSYNIVNIDKIISHYPIKIDQYQLNIPMVNGADLNLELEDGTTFIVNIDNSKPVEQFKINNICINSLYLNTIYNIDDKMYKLSIFINKNHINYIQKDINDDIINIIKYNLSITVDQFLTLFLQLPSSPINLDVITKRLQQLKVI